VRRAASHTLLLSITLLKLASLAIVSCACSRTWTLGRDAGLGMQRNDHVLVVGGTRGTGLLITQLLLRDGYRVRTLARNPPRPEVAIDPAVQVVTGDLTKPETLPRAAEGIAHIIFTAGVRTGPAREALVIATEYQGVLNMLAAAQKAGVNGRFLYMNSIGVTRPSLSGAVLNLVKGNTLRWRRRVEDEIRRSGVNYTIIRAGFLLNSPGGKRAIEVSQDGLPLAPRYKIARADVAEIFVEALKRQSTARTTFDVVWGRGPRREPWDSLFSPLRPDPLSAA
jgi:uncharacterized protein YbjT (DUF2867 family)